MSEKRKLSGEEEEEKEKEAESKRQKLAGEQQQQQQQQQQQGEEQEEQEEQCIVCMRTEPELDAADCPMREEHGCPRCTKTSWRICEECEEHHLSRKCPVCRGEYAPIILYPFPGLDPDTSSSDMRREIGIFRAKWSLMLKIVEGSNTAMFLPARGVLRFLLPQLPGSEYNVGQQEVRFLEVDIPIPEGSLTNDQFQFTDKIWDDLEAAQGVIDDLLDTQSAAVVEVQPEQVTRLTEEIGSESDGAGLGPLVYTDVTVEEVPSSAAHQVKVNDTFFDADDNAYFKIVAVCTTDRFGVDKLYFKSINIDQYPNGPPVHVDEDVDPVTDVYEYTPCDELLRASWVTWSDEQREWIQCVECNKWRKLPSCSEVKLTDLPENWSCSSSTWVDGGCDLVEEDYGDVVSVAEGVNGVLVPTTGDTRTAGNDISNSGDGSNQPAAEDSSVVYTVDLKTAVNHIVSALKENIGNKLLTRLSPETTQSVLDMARQA